MRAKGLTKAKLSKIARMKCHTVSDNDPLKDKIIKFVQDRGGSVVIDMSNKTPHF